MVSQSPGCRARGLTVSRGEMEGRGRVETPRWTPGFDESRVLSDSLCGRDGDVMGTDWHVFLWCVRRL